MHAHGVPIELGSTTIMVCKLCRYYSNLLIKSVDNKIQNMNFLRSYNKK